MPPCLLRCRNATIAIPRFQELEGFEDFCLEAVAALGAGKASTRERTLRWRSGALDCEVIACHLRQGGSRCLFALHSVSVKDPRNKHPRLLTPQYPTTSSTIASSGGLRRYSLSSARESSLMPAASRVALTAAMIQAWPNCTRDEVVAIPAGQCKQVEMSGRKVDTYHLILCYRLL